MDNANRIPVTIITGFLGAGKTTFLNQLIKDHPDEKFAIIENEFGQIGIDGGLIVGVDNTIFELSNGCICCSLNDDFYETIKKLLNSTYHFSHLLIETTGIADPDSIIKAFLSSEDIQLNFSIDSVVCLADSENMEDLMDEQPEVRKQLILADVVLLNKADTIHQNYLEDLVKLIGKINPMATIYPVKFAKVDNVNLLELKAFSAKSVEASTMSYQNLSVFGDVAVNQSSVLATPSYSQHIHEIKSIGFIIPGSFDREKLKLWMQNYLFFNQETVFRIKGIISIADEPVKYVFQSVRSNYMIEAGDEWGTENRFSKLVFIGKELDHDKLEDNLYQLLTTTVEP